MTLSRPLIASLLAAAGLLAACSKPAEAPTLSTPRSGGEPAASSPGSLPPASMPRTAPPAPPVPSSAPVDIAPPGASAPKAAAIGSPLKAAAAAAAAAADPATAGIAWRYATSDADIDAAFAVARAEAKPVFVYWGAKWCPPCNQVKATLFNRQDFIERSRAFVPVYVDGDSPGAQKIGARFRVAGYPTFVIFDPKGSELTRLPGEVDPAAYDRVLTLGLNAGRPVADVLRDARAGTRTLTSNDWRLLAFYAWDTDEQRLVPKEGVPALLKQLADSCATRGPADSDTADAATRLRLKALAAVDPATPATDKPAAAPDVKVQALLLHTLADPAAARRHLDVLTNHAAAITRAATRAGTLQRARLLDVYGAAMQRIEADTSVSRADRITALHARVELAKLDAPEAATDRAPKLPAALLADVRAHAARVDREITDGYERQAVVTTAAYVLQEAGLGAESDALLKANLTKSHSPYYLMSSLASNAKRRGDTAEALRWYGEAYAKSEGPATRLQWGASYVAALTELAPADEARIEATARQLFGEAGQQRDAFYERSARSLQKAGARLQAWNRGGAHAAVMKRLEAQLDGTCQAIDRADPQRASCEAVLKPLVRMTL